MTNQEILKQVVDKAIKNGWKPGYSYDNAEIFPDDTTKELSYIWNKGTPGQQFQQLKDIIFNHDFAKAFWNSDDGGLIFQGGKDTYGEKVGKEWQFHLQQMVLEPKPLTYLEKYL